METREIQLTQGKVALVDAEDYGYLSRFDWQVTRNPGGFCWYAFRSVRTGSPPKRLSWQMHRVVLGLVPGQRSIVDHKDGNGLNNTKANLRVCTPQLNCAHQWNRKVGSTGFKGVTPTPFGKWVAKLAQKHLGTFSTPEEAAAAYDAAALRRYGEYAVTNAMLRAAHAVPQETGTAQNNHHIIEATR